MIGPVSGLIGCVLYFWSIIILIDDVTTNGERRQ